MKIRNLKVGNNNKVGEHLSGCQSNLVKDKFIKIVYSIVYSIIINKSVKVEAIPAKSEYDNSS